jgi:hypothetical protein
MNMNTPHPEHLRQLIENTLSELGMPDADWSCVKANPSGQGCRDTRRTPSEILAVWLADRNEIEFRGTNGSLLTTVCLGPENAELVGAA